MRQGHWIDVIFLFFSLLIPAIVEGSGQLAPPLPARVGGTVMAGNTSALDTGEPFVFKVTKLDGSAYDPVAEDTDGVNSSNWYLLDVPVYDATDQPGGANPGDTAVIHVYVYGQEMPVISPVEGKFTVGSAGSTTQQNITVYAPTVERIPTLGEWGGVILMAFMVAAGSARWRKNMR